MISGRYTLSVKQINGMKMRNVQVKTLRRNTGKQINSIGFDTLKRTKVDPSEG